MKDYNIFVLEQFLKASMVQQEQIVFRTSIHSEILHFVFLYAFAGKLKTKSRCQVMVVAPSDHWIEEKNCSLFLIFSMLLIL